MLYGEVARIGAALASPKRLELLDLLGQAEHDVEAVARALGIDIRLASAHLKALREARLVRTTRRGRKVVYRLAGDDIAGLLVALRSVAESHLAELRAAVVALDDDGGTLTPLDRAELLREVREGRVLLLDVRPAAEYETAHLPQARSIPIAELEARLAELPRNRRIVAYCRGPYCRYAHEAVRLLRGRGYRATRSRDGVREWQAAGLPLETTGGSGS